MRWRKQGRVYAPSGEFAWAKNYAYLPTAETGIGSGLRVYFSCLDEDNYGRIGYVDLDPEDPGRVLEVAPQPVLDLGEPGTFDDAGVNPSCLVEGDTGTHLYYIGWQRSSRVPYLLFAGLAVRRGQSGFQKLGRTPVLERTTAEPFIRSATTILREAGRWRAWYVSALRWTTIAGHLYPEYVIRYAESADGLSWRADGSVCIAFQDPDEFGFGRPWVLRDGGLYRMWYSIRSRTQPYRLGYAESTDGLSWERKDREAGIDRSAVGWDSEMICFPCVVDVRGRRYMFYNGNRHGATGFGYAVLD